MAGQDIQKKLCDFLNITLTGLESAILVKRYLVSSNPKIVKVALQGLLKIWTEHSLKLQKILNFIKYESTNANVS